MVNSSSKIVGLIIYILSLLQNLGGNKCTTLKAS